MLPCCVQLASALYFGSDPTPPLSFVIFSFALTSRCPSLFFLALQDVAVQNYTLLVTKRMSQRGFQMTLGLEILAILACLLHHGPFISRLI